MPHRERNPQDDGVRRSTLWALLIVLALILAVVAGGLYAGWSMLSVPRQFHTGDPMIDAYLQARVQGSLLSKKEEGLLPPKKWQELEIRFGGMARFALLCNTGLRELSISFSHHPPTPIPKDEPPPYIYDAYRQGLYDLPLLLALRQQLVQKWSAALPPATSGRSKHVLSQYERAIAWQNKHRAIAKLHGAEETELLQKMQAVAPDEALPHYLRAIQACVMGDYPAARSALELGNAAPHCTVPSGPVRDSVLELALSGQSPSEDLSVPGLIKYESFEVFNTFDITNANRILATHAARTRDMALLNALNQAWCRLGQATNAWGITRISIISSLEALPDIITVLDEVDLSSAQGDALAKYKTKTAQLRELQNQWFNTSIETIGALEDTQKQLPYRIADRFTSGRASRIKVYRLMGQEFLDELHFFDQHATPLLRDLQRFDFTTLSWRQP